MTTRSCMDYDVSSTSWSQKPSCTCLSSPGEEGTQSQGRAASCSCVTQCSSPMTNSHTWSSAHWKRTIKGLGFVYADLTIKHRIPLKCFLFQGRFSQYLNGKVALSICMHTKKGYSENWTVVMKSSDASVSKLTSTPALMKSMSTVTFPVTTNAPLKTSKQGKFENVPKLHRRLYKKYS